VTTIEFEIPEREFVSLKVFDVRGSEVADLIDGEKSAGSYKVKFNASKLSTGIYFYRLQAGDYIDTKKLLLLK
ncbi:MAG: T9SS type A sorting domain-containing protein, partial [Ignavibacteriaceae bacterium]